MFENFPNEIILLIFSFLELTDLHRIFSSLNSRLEYLLYNSATPLYARLTSEISLPLDIYLNRISQLSIVDWKPNDILELFHHCNLPRLNYISIESSDNKYFGQPTNDLIHQILYLRNLSKVKIKLSPTIYILDNELPESRSIHHMDLSMITLDMLFNLLIHVPELHSLNVWLNSNGRKFDKNSYQDYHCLNLERLTIGLHNDIKFDEVQFLLQHMPVLHSINIFGSVWDPKFLDEQNWRSLLLGQNSLPLLNKININLYVRYTVNMQNVNSILSQFDDEVFYQTNFSIIHDQMFWFHLSCLWNT